MDMETSEILRSTLEILKAQVAYSKKLHGWIGALATYQLGGDNPLASLEAQPLFDQGRDPSLRILESAAGNIDVLLQRLKDLR
jgi:GTP cyclohydrolase III